MSNVPAVRSAEEVLIGRCIRSPEPGERGRDLWLSIDSLARHLISLGGTGSGKSVLLKVVAESMIAKGIPVVVLDIMGDMTGLAVPAVNPESYAQIGLTQPDKISPEAWTIGRHVAERVGPLMHTRYLTPKSDIGERLAIHPLTPRPVGYDHLIEQEEEEVTRMAKEAALVLMRRCGMSLPRTQQGGTELFTSEVITEAFLDAWRNDADLTGPDALVEFAQIVANQPHQLPAPEQKRFDMGIKSLSLGESRHWLVGQRLNWSELLTAPDGKVPVVIIPIHDLFVRPEERPWVVSVILNSLFQWAASQPSAPGRPRVGVFLDELSGGSKNHLSLMPPANYISPSADALRRLLKKGRHYGICMCCGSQGVSDIDAVSLAQFNTKFVGKITDARAAKALIDATNIPAQLHKEYVTMIGMAEAGQMFWIRPDGASCLIKVRWLGTMHVHIKEREVIRALYRLGRFWRPPAQAAMRRLTACERGFCDPGNRLVIFVEPMWSGNALTAIGCAVLGHDEWRHVFRDESEDRLLALAGQWIGCHGALTGVRLAMCGGWGAVAKLKELCDRCRMQLPAIDLTMFDAGDGVPVAGSTWDQRILTAEDYLADEVSVLQPPEAVDPAAPVESNDADGDAAVESSSAASEAA